jgi:hypothetical protein
MSTASNLLDLVTLEAVNQGWPIDCRILVVLILWDTSLAESVKAPTVSVTLVVNCEAVIVSTSDLGDELALKTKLTRNESTQGGAGDDATCKLVLLTCTPSEDFASVIDGKHMIGTSGETDDPLELRNENWSSLSLKAISEA